MAKNPLIYHFPWIVWSLIILALCLTPGNQLPRIEWQLISIGTFAHFSLYSGLAFLMLWGVNKAQKIVNSNKMNLSTFRLYALVISVGICFGYMIELIQGNFIYQRYYDTEDIMINTFGIVFGAFSYSLIGKKLV